jgi:hypothetical protein
MLESGSVINIINNLDAFQVRPPLALVFLRMICEGRETTMTILNERRIALGVILCAAIEIQTLQLRVNEIECGLVKLDERTTTSAVRETRRSDGARTADPCRLNPATPLRLLTRP